MKRFGRQLQRAIAFGVCASLVNVTTAQAAAISCESVASPVEVVRGALHLQSSSRADKKTEASLIKINFDKMLSANDIARLVRKLSTKKYGDDISLRQLLPGRGVSPLDTIIRSMQEQTAREGLIEIFANRELLNGHDQVMTKFAKIRDSDMVALVTSAVSLISLHTAVPFFKLPEFALVKPSNEEIAQLITYGIDSPEGQEIVERWTPRLTSQRRQALFFRAFNTLSYVVGLGLIIYLEHQREEAEAKANGQKIMTKLNANVDQLDAKVDKLTGDTPNDLMYDVVVKKLEARQGSLSAQDYLEVCQATSALHRGCHE